jgi:hypothetical protein
VGAEFHRCVDMISSRLGAPPRCRCRSRSEPRPTSPASSTCVA